MRVKGREQQASESEANMRCLESANELRQLQHGSNKLNYTVSCVCVDDRFGVEMTAKEI